MSTLVAMLGFSNKWKNELVEAANAVFFCELKELPIEGLLSTVAMCSPLKLPRGSR